MRPGEYRLAEDNTYEVTAQFKDRPKVAESVRLKPGVLCERCLQMALERKADLLLDRERIRWRYREEAKRRAADGDPFHCSECRQKSNEWVYLPNKDQEPVGRCRFCLNSYLRNDALKRAARYTHPKARFQATVAALETAKRETRYLFDFVWA